MAKQSAGGAGGSEDMIICRCEEITLGEVLEAIRQGAHDLDAVKRMTRAGMGLCQNKTCFNLVARLISKETGIPLKDLTPFTARPPVRPVAVNAWKMRPAELAGQGEA
jgi:NAD(P)H-nitrite reductase large subunit